MTGEKTKSTSAQTFAEYLERTRRRRTPERFMVLRSAEECKGHFTVEDVCQRLLESGQRVATATVYSTVQLLVDCGILLRHAFDSKRTVYEITPAVNHHHLICTRCGRIKDVRDTELIDVLKARRYSAFTPSSFALSVYGTCSACMRRAKSEARKVSISKPTIHKAQ